MSHSSALLKEAKSHLPEKAMEQLSMANNLAKEIYGDVLHFSGKKLLTHTEQITRLMLPLHPDMTTLIACLLQHVENNDQLKQIEQLFGKTVSRIIQYTSILDRPDRIQPLSSGYLRKIALVLSEDVRVILICLHNRWHLLQDSESLPPKQRIALAREVMEVFAPISARLGVYSIKYELETLAFNHLYEKESKEIAGKMYQIESAFGPFLNISKRALEKLFFSEEVKAVVLTRKKHPYSIFRKMVRKGISNITDIQDLFGIRIIVETEEDCYRTLGLIHRTYRPIMHRVKDFIAFGKPNGYRSLHTTVLGLNLKDPTMPIEIQIRTNKMNEEAEYGIAAHWSYKEGSMQQLDHTDIWKERMQLLKDLSLEKIDSEDDDEDGKDRFQEIISDRIFVLTPKGDPIELPKGATPLDFAFRIHTDIGLQFKGARVNGVIAPMDQMLDNGDMVDIIRQKLPNPSKHWITIATTSEARQKLRTYFRLQGEAIHARVEQKEPTKPRKKIVSKKHSSAQDRSLPKVILPIDVDLPYRFAKCCKVDHLISSTIPIQGFVTRENIVTIHKKDCHMMTNANKKRFVDAQWKAKQ